MNVEIGTEAAQFPAKEYINGIFLAMQQTNVDIDIDLNCLKGTKANPSLSHPFLVHRLIVQHTVYIACFHSHAYSRCPATSFRGLLSHPSSIVQEMRSSRAWL
jgi:hypothetical protein